MFVEIIKLIIFLAKIIQRWSYPGYNSSFGTFGT